MALVTPPVATLSVPLVVMGPPVKPAPLPTLVTVPPPAVTQVGAPLRARAETTDPPAQLPTPE
jgi:hypothetical protein